MNDVEALWAGCLAAPTDNNPRLIFADKFEDCGCTELASAFRGGAGLVFVVTAAGEAGECLYQRLTALEEQEKRLKELRHDTLRAVLDRKLSREMWDDERVTLARGETRAADWELERYDLRILDGYGRGVPFRVEFRGRYKLPVELDPVGVHMNGVIEGDIDPDGGIVYEVIRANLWGRQSPVADLYAHPPKFLKSTG